MLLVYGTAGMALAALVLGVTMIGSRNPRPAFWAGESLVANIYVPLIITMALLGTGCLVKFFLSIGSQALGLREITLAVGIAATCFLLLKLLRIKQQLAEFDAVEKSAEIIKPTALFNEEVGSNIPEASVKPTLGKKAA